MIDTKSNKTKKNDGISYLVAHLLSAKDHVQVVSGSEKSNLYETLSVYTTMETLLKRNVKLRAIVGQKENKEFYEQHPNLSTLYHKYPELVEITESNEFPYAHFGIIDGKAVFYEDNEKNNNHPYLCCEYGNQKLTDRLYRLFEELTVSK